MLENDSSWVKAVVIHPCSVFIAFPSVLFQIFSFIFPVFLSVAANGHMSVKVIGEAHASTTQP